MPRTRRRDPCRVAIASVAAAGVLAACGSGAPPVDTASGRTVASACINRVTPDCSAYTYRSPRPGTVVVRAPRSGAINNREFFWSPSAPTGTDQTVCATFEQGMGLDQQGVVLRLTKVAGDAVTGITVTRNVWGEAFDVFNFHVWDTRPGAGGPFVMFGSTVVPTLPVRPAVYPLHLCARTVASTGLVQFVVWTPGRPKPAWGSSGDGGQATLPPTAPTSGRGGWFAGHLRPGTSMTYTDLTIDGVVPRILP